MGYQHRFGYCKFFRGLIASRQPEEIVKLVESYNTQLKAQEASYIDLMIKSGGLLTYKDIMEMPVDALSMFVERYNTHTEDQNQQLKAAQAKGGRR